MNSNFLPLDPLLLDQTSLDYLQVSASSSSKDALAFDYSDWIHPQTSQSTPSSFEGGNGALGGSSLAGMTGAHDERWARVGLAATATYPSPFGLAGPSLLESAAAEGSSSSLSRRFPSSVLESIHPLAPLLRTHLASPSRNASSFSYPPPFSSITPNNSFLLSDSNSMMDGSSPLPTTLSGNFPLQLAPPPPPSGPSTSRARRSTSRLAAMSTSTTTMTSPPARSPHPDESVPEAALHLLRLALPSASTGSVATNTTLGEDDDGSDQDAEGESDATSLHSDDGGHSFKQGFQLLRSNQIAQAANVVHRAWDHGGGGGSNFVVVPVDLAGRRGGAGGSVASSMSGSARRRSHRPARVQRELSVSTRAGSEDGRAPLAGSRVGRRTSTRVRKPVQDASKALVGDYESSEPEDRSGADSDGGKKTGRSKGKGKSTKRSRSASPGVVTPATKKVKSALPTPPTTVKPRVSRRPRRPTVTVSFPTRRFPPGLEICPLFPRIYRTFPVSSAFPPDSMVFAQRPATSTAVQNLPFTMMQLPQGAKWNKAMDPLNLYAPRMVRGVKDEKEGLCPICVESPERGGEGEEKWLKLKNSSYVYHLSYQHGISNLTGLPFSPPTAIRTVELYGSTKDTRTQMTQGRCHKCLTWIPMQSVKTIEPVVPELIYWKHAKSCHGNGAPLAGEGDYYNKDSVLEFVMPSAVPVAVASGSGLARAVKGDGE